jgi:hypothetical protein
LKKFRVKIYTTSPDLSPECIMDEFMIRETFPLSDEEWLILEDDTTDKVFEFNSSQIVGIEYELIEEK